MFVFISPCHFHSVLNLCCCDRNTMTKISSGRKEFISAYNNTVHNSLNWGESGKELKQGKNEEAGVLLKFVKQCCLLCFSLVYSAYFLITPRTTSPRSHCPQWAGPSTINHQSQKCTLRLPTGQRVGGVFSTKVPSFQIAVVYVKLIWKPVSTTDPLWTWHMSTWLINHNYFFLVHPPKSLY